MDSRVLAVIDDFVRIWVFLIAVGIALTIGARFLREGEAAWRKQAISEEES